MDEQDDGISMEELIEDREKTKKMLRTLVEECRKHPDTNDQHILRLESLLNEYYNTFASGLAVRLFLLVYVSCIYFYDDTLTGCCR